MTLVRRNALILFASEMASSVLLIVSGFIIAHGLSVNDFGSFTAALSFASIMAIMADSGMGMLAARDIARGTPNAMTALDQLFSWRLAVMAGLLVVTPLLAHVFFFNLEARSLAFLLSIAIFLQGLVDFCCWVFKGAQRVYFCAFLQVTSRVLLLFGVILALRFSHTLGAIKGVYVIVNGVMSAVAIILVAKTLHPLRFRKIQKSFFIRTIPALYRLGAILILGVTFSRADVMLVARLRGDMDAGLYSAASRLLDGVRLLPMMAYNVFLPIFAALHAQPNELRPKFLMAYEALFLSGLVIALIGSSFGKLLLTTLLGARYAAAEMCVRAVLWSAVPMCVNMILFALLYALGDEKTPLIGIALAVGLDVFLNILWLPHGPVERAGWIRVISDVSNGVVLSVGLLRKGFIPLKSLLLRPALLAASCFLLLWLLRGQTALWRLLCPLSVCVVFVGMRLPWERRVTI